MTVREKLQYMLNVPEDYDVMDIAIFLSEYLDIKNSLANIMQQLEKEEEEIKNRLRLFYVEDGRLKHKSIANVEESKNFEIYMLTDMYGNVIIDNRGRY